MVGVFIGYDKPRPMGKGQTGGVLAAPIFTEFMKVALKDAPPKEFQVPPGHRADPDRPRARACARTASGEGVILEAFKPGTAPPSTYSIIGYQDHDGHAGDDLAGGRPGGFHGNRRAVLKVAPTVTRYMNLWRRGHRCPRLLLIWRYEHAGRDAGAGRRNPRRGGADPEASLTGMSLNAASRS